LPSTSKTKSDKSPECKSLFKSYKIQGGVTGIAAICGMTFGFFDCLSVSLFFCALICGRLSIESEQIDKNASLTLCFVFALLFN
jgi:uncharacterized membrane protein